MANHNLKKPKVGAGERLRKFYNKNIRPQGPLSPELREIFETDSKKEKNNKPKKSARSDNEFSFKIDFVFGA